VRWQFRGLIAAGVGAGLVLVWWGVFRAWPQLAIDLVPNEGCANLGCALGAALVSLVLAVALVVMLSIAIGWLVLHAARVRPAWPAALLGPVLGWVIGWLADPVLPEHPVIMLVPPVALGYGLAAIASTPRKA
jgi:hypothetical protein